MKRLVAIMAAAAGFASCNVVPAHEVTTYREGGPHESTIVVEQEPPAAQVEVVGVGPSPGHVWVTGYWWWDHRWVWVSGRWVAPPRPGVTWVAGGWVHRPHGWVWVGGYWRH